MLKTMTKSVTLPALIFVVASCVGDGSMSITGSIVDNEEKPVGRCKLELWLADENRRFGGGIVEPNFREDFVISPYRTRYYVSIECPGYRTTFKSDVFSSRGKTYAKKPLDLGTVVMSD